MEAAQLLNTRPVLAGPLPEFDPAAAPGTPGELFLRWLEEAVRTQVAEPQAVTLSTADARGRPSSRVLLLRDVDAEGARWAFASSADSRKGRELRDNPWAALCAYWREQGRQVRVVGTVAPATPEESARQFLARPVESRLTSLTGRQSAPMSGLDEFDAARREAERLLGQHPEAVAPGFSLYTLWAEEVEFWQGDSGRRHVRLRYTREEGGGWSRGLLWP